MSRCCDDFFWSFLPDIRSPYTSMMSLATSPVAAFHGSETVSKALRSKKFLSQQRLKHLIYYPSSVPQVTGPIYGHLTSLGLLGTESGAILFSMHHFLECRFKSPASNSQAPTTFDASRCQSIHQKQNSRKTRRFLPTPEGSFPSPWIHIDILSEKVYNWTLQVNSLQSPSQKVCVSTGHVHVILFCIVLCLITTFFCLTSSPVSSQVSSPTSPRPGAIITLKELGVQNKRRALVDSAPRAKADGGANECRVGPLGLISG